MNGMSLIILLIGFLAIVALIAPGWTVFPFLRFIGRSTGLLLLHAEENHRDRLRVAAIPQTLRCKRDSCLADNPADARFCRRCGMDLAAVAAADERQQRKARRREKAAREAW